MKNLLENLAAAEKSGHACCLHVFTGILLMVVKDGHVVMKCCKCEHMEQVHRDHMPTRLHHRESQNWYGQGTGDRHRL